MLFTKYTEHHPILSNKPRFIDDIDFKLSPETAELCFRFIWSAYVILRFM